MRQSVFIFVPGSNDPGLSDCLPRPPIPSSLLSTFIIQKLPNWRFVSNPCRMTLFSQEIVIFRSDLTSRLMRHAIREPKQNLPEQTVKTILSQSHLAPFPQRISPIFWGWDHALERNIKSFTRILAIIFTWAPLIKIWCLLVDHEFLYSEKRLFPLPDLLILCDSHEGYNLNLSGTMCINPSSFNR